MLGIVNRDDQLLAARDTVQHIGYFTDQASQHAGFGLRIPLSGSPPARHDVQFAHERGGPDQLFHYVERDGGVVRESGRRKTDRTRLGRLFLPDSPIRRSFRHRAPRSLGEARRCLVLPRRGRREARIDKSSVPYSSVLAVGVCV